MANQRKVYVESDSTPDACPKCGCRHYERASAFKRGNKVVVEMTCRNCGNKISS